MEKITRDWIELLFLKFTNIFGEKFSQNYKDERLYNMWCDEWLLGLVGIELNYLQPAIDRCRQSLEWSPSISKFRSFCEEAAGYPSWEEAFRLAIKRDFSHPIIKLAFDKIGDWSFSRLEENDARKRFMDAYDKAIAEQRMEFSRQYALENDPKISQLKDSSHGSEVSRSDTRGSGVRKAEGYLP